jgi:hypothetical protein
MIDLPYGFLAGTFKKYRLTASKTIRKSILVSPSSKDRNSAHSNSVARNLFVWLRSAAGLRPAPFRLPPCDLFGFIQPPFQSVVQSFLRGLRSRSTHRLDILTNELAAAMCVFDVLVSIVTRHSANIQSPAFARPRNIAVGEMFDVAVIHGSHLQKSVGFDAEQLGDCLSNHRGGLVALQDRNRWRTPGQIEVNQGEIAKRPATAVDIQAGALPHLEADRFAVNLDALAVKLRHLSGEDGHSRKLKPAHRSIYLALKLKLVHVVSPILNTVYSNQDELIITNSLQRLQVTR